MGTAIERAMRSRQAKNLPSLWLFTDERIDPAMLLAAVARLPRGAGIVFRHYGWEKHTRRAMFRQVRALAARRGLLLLLGGDVRTALAWQADGWHRPTNDRRRVNAGHLLRSAPCHDRQQLYAARREGADLAFLSPVFTTRSHPGARSLGPLRFGLWIEGAGLPVVALGGMSARRFTRLRALGAYGWGAIDALSAPQASDHQNLKTVPR